MNEYEKNVYTNLFEYPTKKIVELELKNEELKQENEFLKLNNPEQNIEHFRIVKENKRKIDNLRKENERLRENAEHNDKVVDKAKWNEMIYKSRCEKAIDILLCYGETFDSKIHQEMQEKLLNILQGSDEE